MGDPMLTSRFRRPVRGWFAAGFLWTAILFLGGASNALAGSITGTHDLRLQFPSRVIVDKGTTEDGGNYLMTVDRFSVLFGTPTGSLTPLTLIDFVIPATASVFGEFFSFQFEDPDNPGFFTLMQDISLTWDIDSGAVVSDPFRVKLTFNSFGFQLDSFYDLTLTTAGVPAIACPPGADPGQQNTHGALNGVPLPVGDIPPAGEPLKWVAMACAVEEIGVANDLSGTIPVLEINGILAPEPSAGLLMAFGLIGLTWFGRRRGL